MAKVVITIEDGDETVDISAKCEPIPSMEREDTPAQKVAAFVIEYLKKLAGEE